VDDNVVQVGPLRWAREYFVLEVLYASSSCEQGSQCEGFQEACEAYEVAEYEGCPDAWGYSAVSCYHPLKGFRTFSGGVVFSELHRHDIVGDVELPCGQCIGCRMRRASDWALRVMHEASCWERNCFVTLTYGRGNLPPNGSLCHRDFQLFLKRVRRYFAPQCVRFFMCGEYGPLNLRPHYHACLFNVDFRSDRVVSGKSASGAVFFDSPLLCDLWGCGIVSVQDLSRETAGYCARYIMKKVLGPAGKQAYSFVDADGVICERKPEYAAMSLKPGIGAAWFSRYESDVYPHDFVIADGVKHPVPRYYDKLLKRGGVDMDGVVYARELRARSVACDNSDERRVVREVVHTARVRTLSRGLE
jgi:hypothetical protein